MKKICLAILLLSCSFISRADYISYYLMHEAIDNTLGEERRQGKIRDEQVVVTTLEETNRAETGKLERTYGKIVSRLSKLGLAIDAAFLVQEAYPVLNSIITTQNRIIERVKDYPHIATIAVQSEIQIVKKAHSLINYMAGLMLSIGDFSGMKAGDRKLLLGHALSELKDINRFSFTMLSTINGHIMTERLRRGQFDSWVNREKDVVIDIIHNAKKL